MTKLITRILFTLAVLYVSVIPAHTARFLGGVETNSGLNSAAYDNQYQCEEEADYGESCVKFHNNCGGNEMWAYEAIMVEWWNYIKSGDTLTLIEFDDTDGDGIADYGGFVCSLTQ